MAFEQLIHITNTTGISESKITSTVQKTLHQIFKRILLDCSRHAPVQISWQVNSLLREDGIPDRHAANLLKRGVGLVLAASP